MRERYRIKDHHRLNRRTRRGRLIVNGSSGESFNEEMADEPRMNKAKLKIYDEVIGVPVPRRARSGLKRRPQDSVIAAQPSNASKGSREEMVLISESEVEVAKFLFGLTRLNSQDSDATADTFQSSSVPDISTLSKDSKRKKKSRHVQTNETGKSSITITYNSKSDGTTNQVNSNSSVPISSTSGQQADSSSCIKEMAALSPMLHKISSPNNSGLTKIDAQFLGSQNSVSIPILGEEKPSPMSHINAKTLTLPDHHERPNSNATCKTQHEQTEQLSEMESQMKRDLPPLSPQNDKLDPHKSASSVSSAKDCGKRVKYEIDLMALPDDGEGDATDEFNPQVSDFNQKKTSPVPSAIRRDDVWCEAHIKKNGEVPNAHVANCMVKIQHFKSTQSSQTLSIKDDALSQILGPERNGRVRAMGLGITPSQMSVHTHQSKRIHELENHVSGLTTKLDHLTNLFMQTIGARGDRNEKTMSPRDFTPQSQHGTTNFNVSINLRAGVAPKKCKLLNWQRKAVAEGTLSSTDPNALVHHVPLGMDNWKVWVDVALDPTAQLWKPTSEMAIIQDAVATTVAWNKDFISFD